MILTMALAMMLYQNPCPEILTPPLSAECVAYIHDHQPPVNNGLPAEPVIMNTAVGTQGLALEPTDPHPIVGSFLVACRHDQFECSDNGDEFRACARWELTELGLRNARFQGGRCVADSKTMTQNWPWDDMARSQQNKVLVTPGELTIGACELNSPDLTIKTGGTGQGKVYCLHIK